MKAKDGGYSQYAPVSAAFGWELAMKYQFGILRKLADLLPDFSGRIEREGFPLLPISAKHGIRAGLVTGRHKDPFARARIAQAQSAKCSNRQQRSGI
jgi:PIN domain nuclease of toxin-antitoxin system